MPLCLCLRLLRPSAVPGVPSDTRGTSHLYPINVRDHPINVRAHPIDVRDHPHNVRDVICVLHALRHTSGSSTI